MKSAKNWTVPPNLVDPSIQAAYENPSVDESLQQFIWGYPEVVSIRKYLADKIGWDQLKTDETLLPILRNLSASHSTERSAEKLQTTLDSFVNSGGEINLKPRLQAAVDRLKNDAEIKNHKRPRSVY